MRFGREFRINRLRVRVKRMNKKKDVVCVVSYGVCIVYGVVLLWRVKMPHNWRQEKQKI